MHSCKIYVGNLAWATDENALGSHFNCIGKVNEAVVMRSEGRSRGFGFVTFSSSEEAERAITTMNDTELVSCYTTARSLWYGFFLSDLHLCFMDVSCFILFLRGGGDL
ncbi:mCG116386, isoform CRA_d [Phakopsora pachyrhizi]|uniref:MCG116386, isoform CRA_d n=1 Tax=Phakopsora pachyrhizi TaxID=170000 RepID=A0AAV0B5W5_PHAPC|nr:mCG116386, isoform CRA_d [Phakopsora pachyrhizi]